MKKTFQTILSLTVVFALLFALSSVFCADDGIPSVEINENGITWLKESSYDAETWYGIESGSGVFAPGSRFWVKWIDRESNPGEWQDAYNQMDDENKRAIGDNAWIIDVGVTDPDGKEYNVFDGKSVKLYIQLGEDWDPSNVEAFFAGSGNDEQVEATVRHLLTVGERSPEGNSEYLILTLWHLGGTLLVGEFDASYDLRLGSIISDASFPPPWLIVTVVAVVAVAAFCVVFFLVRKKKTNA